MLQVIAEHKHWVQDKALAGRIYLSTQGINAQYSGLTAHAEGYAMWLQEQEQFKVRISCEAMCRNCNWCKSNASGSPC